MNRGRAWRGQTLVFQRSEFGLGGAGGAVAVAVAVALDAPIRKTSVESSAGWRARLSHWAADADLVPDLGQNIGSASWWRGLATCLGLCGTMLLAAPGFGPAPGASPAALSSAQFDQLRAQSIAPLAFGADSGQRMGPTDAVVPLTHAPERPRVDLDAVIGVGDSLRRLLQRAGVSAVDASAALSLIGGAVDPESISAGTRVGLTLGRRASLLVPRPLDALSVRARLDLQLEIARQDGTLTIRQIPIAVDDTPLRVRGRVGDGLYNSARAAGADPATIQAYLKIIAERINLDAGISSDDRFDIIVAHRRAETGEAETGKLLFAGLERADGKDVRMLRWTVGGRDQWFEASGVGESRGRFEKPVSGHLTSNFGMRFHPILGYSRMHQGVDFGAPTGTPIVAVTAGRVAFAGRHGGHGNYVKLDHGSGLATGYAHMSRIAVTPGERVRQGEVIGYVGSTGISTGPHLHYEVFRNGLAVNPMSVKFMAAPQLAGSALAAFKAKLARLTSLPVGVQAPRFAGADLKDGRKNAAASGVVPERRLVVALY